MQNRIKRHFILAGEAATDGSGIVKNCEQQKCGAGAPFDKLRVGFARACFSEMHAARAKVPVPHAIAGPSEA